MPLTISQINALKRPQKDYWLSDESGLRLLVKTNGSKYWRLKYRFSGKQKTLALGVYPDVSLKEARILRDKARIQISEGLDPSFVKSYMKEETTSTGYIRFSDVVVN